MSSPSNTYQQHLEEKISSLKQLFADIPLPQPIDVYPSPEQGFRMRAEFRIWHQDGHAHYAMYEPGQKAPYVIPAEFPIASDTINELMPRLLKEVNNNIILSKKLFCVEFLTTLSGEALVTLIYHRPLADEWIEIATQLEQKLGIAIIGRSRKQKVVISRDYVDEVLCVDGKQYCYRQFEGGFTQPNAVINQTMLGWAKAKTSNSEGDLLELYCGNGNFTTVLAANFDKVLATEIAKVSVKCAFHNFERNGISNVAIARMASEELSSAMRGDRAYRRLQDIKLEDYQFSTLLVDPPRAGLDSGTLALAQNFERILYISCNPLTLKDNLKELSTTHSISEFAVFDQFPWTKHLECACVITKNA